ncbi:site-specific integrase [Chromohalobacter israelensis]|uniref:site-specific integrase n=1 Tax=Chromohalobacter israelensis TaxID=141390 RepID=UPI001C64422E|nr:site-specific integrase [Chromohalobacter salexigens]
MEGESTSNQPVSPVAPPKPVLSDLLEAYRHHQSLEGVSLKTIDDKQSVIRLLIRICGDKTPSEYTLDDAKRFRDTALKLPPLVTRILRKNPDRTLRELISESDTTISITTYNNYIKNLVSVFSFAIREGYTVHNPFSSMKIKQKTKVNTFRGVFTRDDVGLLFKAISVEKGWKYWIPVLGCYTGLRLNEICQLYKEDIKHINGLWCIHVQKVYHDQHLKTPSSERLIPIHQGLIDLGFIDYVQQTNDGTRIFSDLVRHQKHGYSATPSKWFGRLRVKLGFTNSDTRKDFHSFRHTIANDLKQKGYSENLIGGLLGHTTGGITNNRYGKDYKPEVLLPLVEAISI